jgi:septal ring factor EnvC (AmiA/AmiB activator)
LLTFHSLYAQQAETVENIDNAGIYLDSKIISLDKYSEKSQKIQQRLLKKLQRREAKLLKRLAAKDSVAYRQYVNHGLSYDSIEDLSKDTSYLQKLTNKKNTAIDSLRGVQRFIENQQTKLGGVTAITDKAGIPMPKQLGQLQQQLNSQQDIDNLIVQRTASLESLAKSQNIKGMEGIQKDVYYAKEKIKNWKKITDEPDESEAEAFELLQGVDGFDKYLEPKSNAFNGLNASATAADLQRMGFQTKGSVNNLLQEKLGNNLDNIQQQMADQVQQYTDKLGGVGKEIGRAKEAIGKTKETIGQGKEALASAKENIKKIEKPSFKKNPERGKPFMERLEKSYAFQTSRASIDGLKPAMMDISASVGFKQTPKLSYGIGFGLSTGLGKDWQHLKITYEGITVRAYADWKWIYGFSFQVGYERSFRPGNRPYLAQNIDQQNNNSPTNDPPVNNALTDAFGGHQQTCYLGIMKRYKVNSKWNGTFLIGYNFLWQQEDMRSPFLLRFGWGSN